MVSTPHGDTCRPTDHAGTLYGQMDPNQELAQAQRKFEAGTTSARETRRRVVRKYAKKGLSRRQIAAAMGLSTTRVQQIIDGE